MKTTPTKKRKTSGSGKKRSISTDTTTSIDLPSTAVGGSSRLKSTGFLVKCDIPTRQYIKYLEESKSTNKRKKFILEDLDSTHLLIEGTAREEIFGKVEEWMDEVREEEITVDNFFQSLLLL